MCEVTPKRCEIACTGACHSVVDYTKYDSSCVAKPMKKETETTLFTTEATQQKQHTTQKTNNLSCHPLQFRSIAVCIGARTLHISRHLASVLAPCKFPLQLAALSFSACYTYRCQLRICSVNAGCGSVPSKSKKANVRHALAAGNSGPAFPGH